LRSARLGWASLLRLVIFNIVLLWLVTLAGMAFHFLPWHFFADIEGPRGNAPSTLWDFTILATILGVPGLWLLLAGDPKGELEGFSACVMGFGGLLVTDAVVAVLWGTGHPIDRFTAFRVAFVWMVATMNAVTYLQLRAASPPSTRHAVDTERRAVEQDLERINDPSPRPQQPPPQPVRPKPHQARCRRATAKGL
jgi:hypothetical protein